jgi:hypothetical protein
MFSTAIHIHLDKIGVTVETAPRKSLALPAQQMCACYQVTVEMNTELHAGFHVKFLLQSSCLNKDSDS